jgi:peptidoglycan/xylan/chitin deacetylase (PgdA/CDA1 family)
MVGSRIVSSAQHEIVLTRGLRWRRVTGSTKAVDRLAPAAVEPNPEELEARLHAPSGVSMYVTRPCLDKIGLMDERYFLYFEDLDWGYRARNSCGIGCANMSIVPHHHGTTIGSASTRSAASELSIYLEFRNRLHFVRQHHRSWLAWTTLILVARSFEYCAVGAFKNTRAALGGLSAGIVGETGRPDGLFDFYGRTPMSRKTFRLALRSPSDKQLSGRPRSGADGAARQRAKIAVSLAFHLLASFIRLLRRVARCPARHRLVILYYHTVRPSFRASFARQLDILSTRAAVVPANYRGAGARGGHSVAITFDDAFTSVLGNAIPELRARKMPATIFVPAGSLGAPPVWEIECKDAYDAEVVATGDALRTQISDLVELGAHSLTHPHLTRLSRETARREIAGCRERMREIFGVDARMFAFPYGDYDAASLELCRDAGYERVFSSAPHVVDPASDQFVRGRILVDPADGPLEFYLKMHGAYAWVRYVSALKNWLGKRLRQS